jgi:hypothetical protein
MIEEKHFKDIIKKSNNRYDLWSNFITYNNFKSISEIGVYKGDFSARLLNDCSCIEDYYMIDPWRNLSDWNKPANHNNKVFESFYKETLDKTEFASNKRIILKGKTTEVINQIDDESIDLVYIDGDHTLKGITIDLINIWDKIKPGGFIAGDDFCSTIWQHSLNFEPTLIFPFVLYFAEAKGVKVIGLPFNQFVICKDTKGFSFLNLTNNTYKDKTILSHLNRKTMLKKIIKSLIS